MINLCLVVIATQFSETKKRETERMLAERRRFSRSSSTILSDEPGSCWEETIKYLERLTKHANKRLHILWKNFRRKHSKVKDRRLFFVLGLKKKLSNDRFSSLDKGQAFEKITQRRQKQIFGVS